MEAETGTGEHDSDAEKRFTVVIAYDAPGAVEQAVRSVERAVAHAGVFGVNKVLWRFDVINLPAVREEALASAASANLLVLVARSDAALPCAIKDWLQKWADQNSEAGSALLALYHGNRSGAGAHMQDRHFLERIAKKGGHNFFSHELEQFADLPDVEDETPSRVQLGLRTAPFPNLNSGHPYRDWGLNE